MSLVAGITGVLTIVVLASAANAGQQAPDLEEQLLRGQVAERIEAARQLCVAKDPATRDAVVKALADPEPLVRRYAIYTLERMGDPGDATHITPLLKDEDRWVRQNAVLALGKLGSRDSVRALAELLGGDDLTFRSLVVTALGRIGDPSSQKDIVRVMRDERTWNETGPWAQADIIAVTEADFFTDRNVIPILQKAAREGGVGLPGFEELHEDRRERYRLVVRVAAARALVKFGDASGEDSLIEGLGAHDYEQQDSIRALGGIRSRKAVPGIIEQLSASYRPNRRYAVEALGEIGDPAAIPALEEVLEGPDPVMRGLAAEALKKIDGKERKVDLTAPAAEIPDVPQDELNTPGGKRPPQFIVVGVDDCASIEGLETMVDIAETLHEHGSKACFTMWVAPLSGDYEDRDLVKEVFLLRRLFDLGSEIANHTLHHNPGGYNWSSLPPERQVEEVEGCVEWYRQNIPGFTRPFAFKHGGGGSGQRYDPEFTRQLLDRQRFLYRARGGQHPNEQEWPPAEADFYRIPTGVLDGNAPPVHAEITHGITGDYGGKFDFEVDDGAAMWKANFEYHYSHPRRPVLGIAGSHDWGYRYSHGVPRRRSHRNQGAILKEFLMDVLVRNRDEYPDAHCVTLRQVVEYVRTDGDLEQTLAIGNGQDSRNPTKPSIE